jgi:hypothetical protein
MTDRFKYLTRFTMNKVISTVIIISLSATLISGCKKDKGEPPDLPPPESMTIDFANFTSAKKSGVLIPSQKGTENSNWEFAATVAGVWKLIINTTLVVPVTAFSSAGNQTPVNISGKTWQWSYNVTYQNVSYKARLTGQIEASDVKWKMYITRDGSGGFAEFIWFEGTSKTDGSGGQWIFYQSAQSPDAFLQIDWTKSNAIVGLVKYTSVKNGSFKTSFIEYGLVPGDLNAYFTIHYFNDVKFSDVNVEWNTTTHNGRVKSIDYLDNTDWYCWDANKLNTICQ